MKNALPSIAAIALLASPALANPVDVTCSVSGTPGNYVFDFSVTNNLNPDDMSIYFFGVSLDSGRNIAGSPFPYDPDVWVDWDTGPDGGKGPRYNNNWIDLDYTTLFPGQTLSGFKATYTRDALPGDVWFFAYGFAGGEEYTGDDYFHTASNPGFEGIVTIIPAPGSAGIAGLLTLAARRRR